MFSILALANRCSSMRELGFIGLHFHVAINIARMTEPLRLHLATVQFVLDASGHVVGTTQDRIDRRCD